jgi:hypothetical protein
MDSNATGDADKKARLSIENASYRIIAGINTV